jgi:hypothetical protein
LALSNSDLQNSIVLTRDTYPVLCLRWFECEISLYMLVVFRTGCTTCCNSREYGPVIDVIQPKWYFLVGNLRVLQDLRVSIVSIIIVLHRIKYLLLDKLTTYQIKLFVGRAVVTYMKK